MYRMAVVVALFVIVAIPAVSAMSLDVALALFDGGADPLIPYSDEGKVQLEGAIAAFETAVGVPSGFRYNTESAYMNLSIPQEKKDLVTKLAQCYYVLGDVFTANTADVKDVFACGKLWGLKSLRMSPRFAATEKEQGFIPAVEQESDVAALYWTCVDWGRVDEYDKLSAIKHSDPPKLLALIERALEVDDSYMLYGPYRALAGFWGGFPKIPLIKYRQNLPRVLSYICHVVNAPDYCSDCTNCHRDPRCDEYLENRLTFVKYYLIPRRLWKDASGVLTDILSAVIGDEYPLYNAFAQQEACDLLGEVKKHL
jgi:hypothetical protein